MYWDERLPDLSEGTVYRPEDLIFWIKLRNKRAKTEKRVPDPMAAHRLMPGLRGKGLHEAIDFAIAQNKWPCRFTSKGLKYDMVTPFALTVWVHYVRHMVAKPTLLNKSSQKVLHYLLSQPAILVKSWRARVYFYSSATWLKQAGNQLIEWINENPEQYRHRVNVLQKLTDYDDMYGMIGDAIVEFMRYTHHSYTHRERIYTSCHCHTTG